MSKNIDSGIIASFEYQNAENGGILTEPENHEVNVCLPGGETTLIGKSVWGEVKHYMDEHCSQAVSITISIEEITPKY